jgi:hypothetical protein
MAANLRNQAVDLVATNVSGPVGGVVRKKPSWLALVTFCTTTALVLALALAIIFGTAAVALALAHTVSPLFGDSGESAAESANQATAQAVPAATEMTFTGLVTDDHCGARHDMGSGKNPAECANACVHNGGKYALVDGEKTYTLQGNADELARASGRRVNLTGSLQGDTIEVRSITSSQ